MMQISRMAYTRVAHSVVPGPLQLREHSAGVDAFLVDHCRELLNKAGRSESPSAAFVDNAARTLVEALRSGSEDEFLTASQQLAARLIGAMDRRMEPGLLVCLQIQAGVEYLAALLKLEVVTPNSAVLDRLDTGEETLEAVSNVLDAPGDLQKGALINDPRPNSEVIVGDKLTKDALYFPRAFGIRTEARPADGTVELIAAIHTRLPIATERVVAALPEVTEEQVGSVLLQLGERIPELDQDIQSEVQNVLREKPKPVLRVYPKAAVKRVIRAGGITIGGPASAMRNVAWEQLPNGNWQITIEVAEMPRAEYQ